MSEQVSFTLDRRAKRTIKEIEGMVEAGQFKNRSEAIRQCLDLGVGVQEAIVSTDFEFSSPQERKHFAKQAIFDLRQRELERSAENG